MEEEDAGLLNVTSVLPRSVNFLESLRNSTNSMISFFASSHPATSAKVVVTNSCKIRSSEGYEGDKIQGHREEN